MAIMYLAKINLTEGIFDVYDNKLNLDDVKQTIYDELDEKKHFQLLQVTNIEIHMEIQEGCLSCLNIV